MASLFSIEDMEEMFCVQTILALGWQMLSALKKALQIFQDNRTTIPTINTTCHIVWFPYRQHSYDNRIYIFFQISPPPNLSSINESDQTCYVDDLAIAQAHFINTTPTAINLMEDIIL